MDAPREIAGVRGASGQNVDEEPAERFSGVSGRTDDIAHPLGEPVSRPVVREVPVVVPAKLELRPLEPSRRSSTFLAR